MTSVLTLTEAQVEALLAEAGAAGDREMVDDCEHVLRAWAQSVVYGNVNEEPVARIVAAIAHAEAQACAACAAFQTPCPDHGGEP